MIIVSQDKTEIINFNNILKIEVIDNEIIVFYKNTETAGIKGTESIGTYETEERAKEVLQEIIKQKAMFELYRLAPTRGREQTEMLENFAQKRIILDTYEMPEK